MKAIPALTRLRTWHRLALLQGLITLAAVLGAEAGAWGLGTLLEARGVALSPLVRGVIVGAIALGGGVLAGMVVTRRLARRLGHALEIASLWQRGSLALRIGDQRADDLGALAGGLDSLAAQLERDEHDLAELRQRSDRLADQVRLLAVVEERNRLARELHDGVKQQLFSLAITASAVRDRLAALKDTLPQPFTDLAEMAGEMESTARAAQGEMAQLIEGLRPMSIQEQGLAAALNHYSLLFGAREHLLVYVDVQGEDRGLPPSIAESLYRVAQEALHNVARHAHATRVDLALRCLPEQARLAVRDNGAGFDPGQPSHGLGLGNMRERMLALGGSLAVQSRPGEGTAILAGVPIPRHAWASLEVERQEEPLPLPAIKNWPWLGQRLVIPVGQTWPWHPADEAHLRQPLVEPGQGPLRLKRKKGLFHSKTGIFPGGKPTPLAWLRRSGAGWSWEIGGISWALLPAGEGNEHRVLVRGHLPLAAMQEKSRPFDRWSEIIYDGHGYCLTRVQGQPRRLMLVDEDGVELLSAELDPLPGLQLRRSLPLNLLMMVAVHWVEEIGVGSHSGGI